MRRECVWPFCGADDHYQCANCEREEVMQIEAGGQPPDGKSRTVAPPPVSEAGGDHTNDGKTNMTSVICKENAESLNSESACLILQSGSETVQSVPLPKPGINTANHASIRVIGYTAEQLRAYGDERGARYCRGP